MITSFGSLWYGTHFGGKTSAASLDSTQWYGLHTCINVTLGNPRPLELVTQSIITKSVTKLGGLDVYACSQDSNKCPLSLFCVVPNISEYDSCHQKLLFS